MAQVQVKINGHDRSKYVDWRSLVVSTILTQQVDTANFDIKYFGSRDFVPTEGQDVKIYVDSTVLFAGVIATIEIKVEASMTRVYSVQCVDYTRLLDHKLVIDTYSSQTGAAIIQDIISTYCPGFTSTNVVCPLTVNYIAFNYEQPSQCIKQICELFNYDWYIDENKDVHVFAKEAIAAPYDIEDDTGTYIKDTLVIRRDPTKLRNSIIVRGGEYIASTITSIIAADGQQTFVPTQYRLSDIHVTLSGDPQSVGVDNLDNPNDYDCLYNFNEKIVKWKTADKPTAGSEIKISGRPYLPVIVKVNDFSSIAQVAAVETTTTVSYTSSGTYEQKIIDKSIKSKEGARDRATAELYAYAQTLSEGEFRTETPGFRVGQRIRVNSTILGVDDYFVINKVSGRMWTKDRMVYDVSLVTTRTIDFIDFLQKLLTSKDKEIEIAQNEVIDEIEGVFEEVTIGESVSQQVHQTNDDTVTIGELIETTLTSVYGKWGPGYNATWNFKQWN